MTDGDVPTPPTEPGGDWHTPAHNVQESPQWLVIHDTDIPQWKYAEQLEIVNHSHAARGYDLNEYGYNVCYHYFIGTTGKIVHTRPNTDRTMCTLNDDINMKAIHIVLAGDFENEYPTHEQLKALRIIVTALQKNYGIAKDHVIPHRQASPTKCPGKNLIQMMWPST